MTDTTDSAHGGWRVGADIGGTFTDVIALGPQGHVVPAKVLSTPAAFQEGVIDGVLDTMASAGIASGEVSRLLHATTVATNAILERTGARTGLVTTAGFRDVLELGRLRRPTLYDLSWQKPEPLARRRDRFEIHQRIAADGTALSPVDDAEVVSLARRILDTGVEALAVCLVNGFLRPEIEQRLADRLRELLPGVYVTASVDVSPQMHEFERTSTATVNSYVGPVVQRYVDALAHGLRAEGIEAPFTIMQSTGGLLDARAVVSRPVQIIESGPAAGAIAVQRLAQHMGLDSVVAFDMGGTTAKATLIEHGQPFVAADYEVGGGMNVTRGLGRGAGHAVRVPTIDIAEVGAGGGSIISVDVAGAMHVGPASAGSLPGPAAYDNGGELPTLTDANVELGYISPVALAGGRVPIRADLAHAALGSVGDGIGLAPHEVANASYSIAVSNMTKAVKAVTSERGRDPRDAVMVAFGGAGPLYGAALARELGIDTVLVPVHTGVFSSLGLLVADSETQAVLPVPPDASHEQIAQLLDELETQATTELGAGDDAIVERLADMRYRGQRFELRVPLDGGAVDDDLMQRARERFHADHERTYGRRGTDDLVEIVNLRTRASVPSTTPLADVLGIAAGAEVTTGSRECWFDARRSTPVLSRSALGTEPVAGPLIVEDMDSTTLVPPGATAHRDDLDTIVIRWTRS